LREVLTSILFAAGVIGAIQWFGAPERLRDKVAVFVGILLLGLLAVGLPYGLRLWRFARQAMHTLEDLPEIARRSRGEAWKAINTNLMLRDSPLTILQFDEREGQLYALLDEGSFIGIERGMQFEIITLPNEEVHGVVTAGEVAEESTWCMPLDGEGRPDFWPRIRRRVGQADMTCPPNLQVRPFMANAYDNIVGPLMGPREQHIEEDEVANE
jgi:hypothetical protein